MDRFVRSQNVERYRRLLESVTEESKRQAILNLLGEERQKQKDASAIAELVRHRQGDE
jgi:ribonucleotide reductase beta subunit family protein with ferritin-like domain